MRQKFIYSVECVCGRHVETEAVELNCPHCQRALKIEWQAETANTKQEPEPGWANREARQDKQRDSLKFRE